MNGLILLLLLAISLGLIFFLIVILALALANLGWHFIKIEKGNTVFINKGDDLRNIWPNVGGHKLSSTDDLDGRRWLVKVGGNGDTGDEAKKEETEEKQRLKAFFHGALLGTRKFQEFMWWAFSIRFVSFFYPHVRRHTFKVDRKRLLGKSEVSTDAKLKDRVVQSDQPPEVSSLLFTVPRPVYMEGLELGGDNSKINLLFLAVFQQVIPSLPVYYFKGEFFTLLDAAIEAAVVDFLGRHTVDGKQSLTYADWIKLPKGDGGPIEKHLLQINASRDYYNRVREELGPDSEVFKELDRLTHGQLKEPVETSTQEGQKELSSGLIPRFGFALVSLRLVGWEAHAETDALAKALLKKEIEFHTAQGVLAEAEGRAGAITKVALAESGRYTALANALIDKKVDPNVAAAVIGTQIRTENIRESKIITYVEGGAETSVLVGTNKS